MFNVNSPRDRGRGARLSGRTGNVGIVHDDSKKMTSSNGEMPRITDSEA